MLYLERTKFLNIIREETKSCDDICTGAATSSPSVPQGHFSNRVGVKTTASPADAAQALGGKSVGGNDIRSHFSFPRFININIPSCTRSQVACIAGTAWSSEKASIPPRRIRYSDPGRSRPITRSGSRGNDLRYGCHGAGEAQAVTMVLLAYYPIPFPMLIRASFRLRWLASRPEHHGGSSWCTRE